MSEFVIEKLAEKHVNDVAKIERELVGSGEASKIKETILNDNLSYFVLMKDNVVIGFFECLIVSPDAELYDIAIEKDFQGQGLSKMLMQYFVDYVKSKNCETIFLEVNSMNIIAQNLYKSFGFEAYSLRKNYYGKNDAVLMKKILN